MAGKNKLIILGFLGLKKCYLNIPLEEAIFRYKTEIDFSGDGDDLEESVKEIEFDDEFEAYDVWEK